MCQLLHTWFIFYKAHPTLKVGGPSNKAVRPCQPSAGGYRVVHLSERSAIPQYGVGAERITQPL